MPTANDKLYDIITPAVASLGYILWGIEYLSQGKHSILRVYIDHENGISLDDCTQVSRQVSAVLDVADPIRGEYSLEVSSPGLDRPLFFLPQYKEYCGEKLKVRLRTSVNNHRKFTGVLQAVTGDTLQFAIDNELLDVAFSNIEKANVVPQF